MARSPLGWLNLILPKDRSGAVTSGIAYGENVRQRLDVYCPKGDVKNAPILVFIYGGGWSDGDRADYAFVGRAFAAAGFVTIIPDYQLVPDVHFPDFLKDLGAALSWVDAQATAFGGDTQRIFLMGHSAGAYNAMMLGLDGQRFGSPDLADRLRGIIGVSGPYDFYPFDVAASINTFSRHSDPLQTQPINCASETPPAVMLAHGKPDVICGLYNSQNLAGVLRHKSGDVVEHYYDGIGHAGTLLSLFSWLRWRVPVYAQAVAFMRDRCMPDAAN